MKTWLRAPTFSPKGFLVRAAACALLYELLSLAGLRGYMSVLSLTFPEGSPRAWSILLCMAYLVSHFLWILGVPILLLAAVLLEAWDRLESRFRRPEV